MDLVKHLEIKDHSLYSSLQDIRKFCIECWKKPLLPWFTNHDQTHSEEIVRILEKLLTPFEHNPDFLDEQEIFVLLAAAYLHDIGMQYLKVENIAIDSLIPFLNQICNNGLIPLEVRLWHESQVAKSCLKKQGNVWQKPVLLAS